MVRSRCGQSLFGLVKLETGKTGRGFAQRVLELRTSRDSELNSTPQEFANFSGGFLTLGIESLNILSCSERVKGPDGTLSE
jgi:hypothetical protein